ncbi:MAG: HDIG domain-containing protein [Clostridiales bacterium]|jgi:putative nucleotidyltransferase with HDIG domain|nr:HDIG domain-containing protein [Clostridiales bacterium]
MTDRKKQKFQIFIFTAIAFVVTIGCIVSGSLIKYGQPIKEGGVAPRTFSATREIINDVATERLRTAASNSVMPRYVMDSTVNERILAKLDAFFEQLKTTRMLINPIQPPGETIALPTAFPELDINLEPDQLQYLSSISTELFNTFSNKVHSIVDSTLAAGIKKDNDGLTKALSSVRENLAQEDWATVARNAASTIITSVLEPNESVDDEQTRKIQEEAEAAVEPVVYLQGQNIVSAGEIISPEAYAALLQLGVAGGSFLENIYPLIGGLFICGLVFVCGIMYMYNFCREFLTSTKNIVLIFTFYVGGMVICRILNFVPFPLYPILPVVMLVSLLIDIKLAIVVAICLTANAAAANGADVKFLLYYALSGVFVAIIGKSATERNKIFTAALILSLFCSCLTAAIYLLFNKSYSAEMLNMLIYSALAGVFTVIICIGSLPFWEAVFGIITPIKLMEYTNPNNEILKRLIIEAPGTYHHSIIVSNLAETGAYAIGANAGLARVGAYYHDIGKLKYPQYFSENQAPGENPHEFMDPLSSAQVITEHVSNGVELAKQKKLPPAIWDIIATHHGNTLIKYFYFKAKKETPDADIREEDFRYHCARPVTREAAVVMLADTVEAAVRSAAPSGKSMAEIDQFVRTLMKDKLDDNQLAECDLTIKDLNILAAAFMRVFRGMYHERVPYPKATTKELTAAKVHRE